MRDMANVNLIEQRLHLKSVLVIALRHLSTAVVLEAMAEAVEQVERERKANREAGVEELLAEQAAERGRVGR